MQEVKFQVTGKKPILQNFLLALTGHMVRLSVGTSSHDAAGATGGPVASHDSSDPEQVFVKFWIRSSSAKQQTITSQKSLLRGHAHLRGSRLSSTTPQRYLRLAMMSAVGVAGIDPPKLRTSTTEQKTRCCPPVVGGGMRRRQIA